MQQGRFSISPHRLQIYRNRLAELETTSEENGRLATGFNEELEVSLVKDVATVFNNFCKEFFGESGHLSHTVLTTAYIELVDCGVPDAQLSYCVQYVLHARDPTIPLPSETDLCQALRRECIVAEQDLEQFFRDRRGPT